MKREKNRLGGNIKLPIIGAVIIIVLIIAFTANPIQSAITGYFVKKDQRAVNIQTIIDTQGEFESERGDWFNGLRVSVNCDDYNKIASKNDKHAKGLCLGSAEVLYTDFMVKELPAMPKDFFIYRQSLFIDPLIKRIPYDPERFGEDYWVQPEWVVPFEDQKIDFLKNLIEDPRYGVVWGVGTWDDKIIKVTKPAIADEDIVTTVYAWVEPAPATTGYIGVGLSEVFPETGEFPQELEFYKQRYFQTPEITERHFDLKIEPDEFLLQPNFPYFHQGYRRMIKLTLTIKKDTPQGIYLIGMQPDKPSREFSDKHRAEDPANYWDPYSGFARIGSPYQILIEVNV